VVASAALSSRVAGALDAMHTVAADLDASWMAQTPALTLTP
jgi:hypothetical protein